MVLPESSLFYLSIEWLLERYDLLVRHGGHGGGDEDRDEVGREGNPPLSRTG